MLYFFFLPHRFNRKSDANAFVCSAVKGSSCRYSCVFVADYGFPAIVRRHDSVRVFDTVTVRVETVVETSGAVALSRRHPSVLATPACVRVHSLVAKHFRSECGCLFPVGEFFLVVGKKVDVDAFTDVCADIRSRNNQRTSCKGVLTQSLLQLLRKDGKSGTDFSRSSWCRCLFSADKVENRVVCGQFRDILRNCFSL